MKNHTGKEKLSRNLEKKCQKIQRKSKIFQILSTILLNFHSMLQASIPKVPQNTIFRHHSQITRKIPFQLQKQKKNPIKSSIPVIFTLSRAHTQSSSWNEENKKKTAPN